MTSPVAGWYPDPSSSTEVRWWDGARWTHHVRPNPTLPPPEPAQPNLEPAQPNLEPVQPSLESAKAVRPTDSESTLDTSITPARTSRRGPSADRRLIVAAAGVLAGVLAIYLPWMTSSSGSAGAFEPDLPWLVTGGDLQAATDGIIGHGLIYAILLVGAAAAAMQQVPRPKLALLLVGGSILALTVANTLQLNATTSELPNAGLSLGYGVYLMALAGVGVMAAGLLTARDPAKSTTTQPRPT